MKDTTAEVQALYYRILAERPQAERAHMIADTYSAMRRIVLHSLRHLPEPERSVEYLRRFYRHDLDSDTMEYLLRRIRKSDVGKDTAY